jgi:sugar phosphate isomerase/epimerase
MKSWQQNRREFLRSSLVTAGVAAAGLADITPAWAKLPFRFGHTLGAGTIEETISLTARIGYRGIEPARNAIIDRKPDELRKLFEAAGRVLNTCSNEGQGVSLDWVTPEKIPQTIKDHVATARFLADVGMSRNFKIVPTRARDLVKGPSDDELKRMSDAWNEAGRQMAAFGIKMSPHNPVGTPFYMEREIRRVMELTDPRYVFICADTSHLQLAGMDSASFIKEFLPRIAEVHYKDTLPEYRNTGRIMNEASGTPYFRSLGAGGVDFPAVQKVLVDANYSEWVNLDLAGAPDSRGKTTEQLLVQNRNYLIDVMKIDSRDIG